MELSSSSFPEFPGVQPVASEEAWRLFPEGTSATKELNIDAPKPDTPERGGILSARYCKPVKAPLMFPWPTIGFLLGLSLLVFSLCSNVHKIYGNGNVRRLADDDGGEEYSSGGNPFFGEDEWIPLDADELAVLCAQVGEWTPSAVPQRPSPLPIHMPEVSSTSNEHVSKHIWEAMMKPSYLSRASSNVQQQRAVGSTQHKGKRTSEGGSDGWGPSPKKFGSLAYAGAVETSAVNESGVVQQPAKNVQQTAGPVSDDVIRYGLPPLITAFFQQGVASSMVDLQGAQQMQLVERPVSQQSPTTLPDTFSAPSTIGAVPTLEPCGGTTQAEVSQIVLDPAINDRSAASTVPSPQRIDEASSGLSERGRLSVSDSSSVPISKHPFVRTPTLMSYVKIADIEERFPESWISDESTGSLHRIVRHLSLKPALNLSEANELVSAAITLARRALSSMTTPVVNVKASVAAEALGRRFLVFNTFHTILKLTGDSKPHLRELWQDLVANIPTAYGRPPRAMYNTKHAFQHKLSHQVSAALESYKNGSSLSEAEVLDIKRKLFCMEFSPRCFLREAWDRWRQDDREFTGAS